tara:strand:- start:663 stop:1604 length:942 start_codon:yes stop_codon:yes gene_type:complete
MTFNKLILIGLCWIGALTPLKAQTCCTGGIPLTGAINLNPSAQGIRAGLTYDVNRLSDFVQGERVLNNSFLKRKTSSAITQVDFFMRDSIGFSVLIPYSYLSEENTQTKTTYKASGLGDISVWANKLLLNSQRSTLAVAVGIKLPTGETNIKDESGNFDLPISLQPGTGSIDFMLASFFQSTFKFRPSLSYSATGVFKVNTVGKRYDAHPEYRYSNELDFYLGLSEQVLLLNQLVTPQVQLRWNHFGEHIQNRDENPNTGGSWLYLGTGFSWASTQKLSLSFRGQWPILRTVNGFQLTTTDRFSLSAFYSFIK